MIWTDAVVSQLRDLWAAGLTCAQIATALGCTRNAVIGKAHRLGLPMRVAGPTATRKTPFRKPRPPKRPPMVTEPIRARPEPTLDVRDHVAFELRPNGRCCWPIGKTPGPAMLVCGAPLAAPEGHGLTFCQAHREMAWSKGTPSEREAQAERRREMADVT